MTTTIQDNPKVKMILLDEILVEGRMREELGEIEELADNIKRVGLINPIRVALIPQSDAEVYPAGKKYKLVAGERRFRAHEHLSTIPSYKKINPIPIIACYIMDMLAPLELQLIELCENLDRKDFEWWEEVRAVQSIHKAFLAEARAQRKSWKQKDTATRLNRSVGWLSEDLKLAEWVEEIPILKSTKSRAGALQLLERLQEEFFAAELARRQKLAIEAVSSPTLAPSDRELENIGAVDALDEAREGMKPGDRAARIARIEAGAQEAFEDHLLTPEAIRRRIFVQGSSADKRCTSPAANIHIINDDCAELLAGMNHGTVDLVLADPPYAIDKDALGPKAQRFTYLDNRGYLELVIPPLVRECFRVCKADSFMLIFCGRELEDVWRDAVVKINNELITADAPEGCFELRHSNLIWVKQRGSFTDSRFKIAHAYENILLYTRGRKRVTRPHTDVFFYKRPRKTVHAGEKPVGLLRQMINVFSMPGDVVLDPMAGTFSTAIAAMDMNRVCVAAELDERTFGKAIEKMTRAIAARVAGGAILDGTDGSDDTDGDGNGSVEDDAAVGLEDDELDVPEGVSALAQLSDSEMDEFVDVSEE